MKLYYIAQILAALASPAAAATKNTEIWQPYGSSTIYDSGYTTTKSVGESITKFIIYKKNDCITGLKIESATGTDTSATYPTSPGLQESQAPPPSFCAAQLVCWIGAIN